MNASIEPYALQTDRQYRPRGILDRPSFSWRLRGHHRGAGQFAFRITVTAELGIGDPVPVWNPGWVESAQTLDVAYSGPPLVSSTRYRWQLTVRDADGAESSAEADFATAVLHPDEWRASWIARNPLSLAEAAPPRDTDITYTVNKLKPVRRFVKHFHLAEPATRAVVHASARGIYRLYLNGQRVGNDELVPGWTEYRERLTYQSWDVTSLLRPGANALAALVGDGWYVGFIGTDRRHQAQHYGEETAFLAQLQVSTATGGQTVIGTDGSWRESASETVYADLLMGQYEDARRRQDNWHEVSCDLTDWSPAVVVDSDHTTLVPESDPAVRATEIVNASSVTPRSPQRCVVDFGQNLVGHVRLTLRDVPAGVRVQLNHAEVLTEDGELYTENLRTAEPVDVYWTNDQPVQTFEPRFTVHGFRFLEVSGLVTPPAVGDVQAVVVHNAAEPVGELETSSADLNQLASNIRWGLRGNFLAVPTDCPQRDERLGWTADAQVFAPTATLHADRFAFFRRWLRDVRSAQSDEGAFPDIAPHLVHLREGAPAWGDAGVTLPWHLYRTYGSVAILEESVDSMLAWVRYLQRHNPDLTWRHRLGNNYGDWLQVGEETPKEVLATAYFARSTELTARALAVVGRPEEAAELTRLRDGIRQAFREAFLGPDGRLTGDTQTGYLLALGFDLVSGSDRDAVAEHLVEAIERRGRSLTTGFVGVALLCPVLTSIGRSDLAFALLHNDRYPSWLYSIRNGATTIWERWDGWTQEHGFQSARMNSFNHYSLGSVGEWLYRCLAGIDQDESSVAYSRVRIAPQLDPDLTYVRGAFESPRGRIASSWTRSAGRVELQVEVPPGAHATVVLPPGRLAEISEGGQPVEGRSDVSVVTADESGVHLGVPSGRYRFTIPDPSSE